MYNIRLWGMGLAAFLLFSTASQAQDSLNVSKVGEIEWIWGEALDVVLSGNYAFVGCSDSNFVSVNVADPANPIMAGNCRIADTVEAIAVVGDYALLACDDWGFRVVDISDPGNMVEVLNYQLYNTWFHGIEVSGNYAYLVVETWEEIYPSGWLRVFDISNSASPAMIDSIALIGYSGWDVAIDEQGAYAYVLCGYPNDAYWLDIINVADPSNLMLISYYEISGIWGAPAHDISISGNCVYVAAEDYIHFLDVSNPSQPISLNQFDPPGEPWDLQIIDGHAPIAAGSGGIRILNVTNSTAPLEIGYYDTPGYSKGIFVLNNYAYVADGNYFGIYDVSAALPVNPWETTPSQPTSFILHPPHPNPFNPSTVASFELRVASRVRLQVYNTAGELVTTLVDGWKPAGTHQVKFDGSALPSGIYLARLTAGDFSQTQKMVLLK